MQTRYYPPTFEARQFHCIRCGVFAQQNWSNVIAGYVTLGKLNASECLHCAGYTLWYGGKILLPAQAPVELAHSDLPDDCKADFEEAREVFSKSPRSSAALLRLCIQKLMPHLGESGKNINDDIGSLVSKGLPVLVQKALDFCRVVGNNAVHPGELNINDTPEVAQSLFQMINFIVEDRITKPKEIDNLYAQLPESSRAAIEKRDKA